MRVNISYSIELDDVPHEVEQMLIECSQKIREVHGRLDRALGREPLAMIKELDEIRMQMSRTDLRLDDCMQILSGYVQAKAELPRMQHGTPQESIELGEETKDE